MAKEKFEEAFKKLEKIVSKMEGGELPLEESLKLFEEGMRLYGVCNQRLTEVQKKIELLTLNAEGKWAGQPFPMEEDPPASNVDEDG